MLLRNILEIALIGILLLLGLVIYLYTSRRVRDVESDVSIRKKKDIHGKLEDEE